MKHYLLLTAATLGMAASSLTTATAQDDDFNVPTTERKLIATYTIGSTQETGQTGDESAISRKEINYYDLNNRLVYTAKYGIDVRYTGFTLTNYTKYDYTQQGDTLVQTALYDAQWGQNDFGDYAFKYNIPTKLTVAKYVDGKLVKKDDSGYTYTYEYGDNGLVSKLTKVNIFTGSISEAVSYTYSDGLLIVETATDNLYGLKYKNVYEYDENGNKTLCYQYKRTTKDDEKTEYIAAMEEWIYNDGVLTDYYKSTGGQTGVEPTRSTHTTYEPYQNNPYQTLITTYSYTKAQDLWTRGGLPKVEVYADLFDAETNQQMFATTVKATPIEGTHNVDVSFQLPTYASFGLSKFTVYRDCHPIATIDITSPEVDQETGMVNLVDSTLRQGSHEYFVGIEIGNADELAEDESDVTWTYANISDATPIEANFDLKPVTDLKFVKAEKTISEDGDGAKVQNLTATITYKKPEYKPEDGFIKNELYTFTTFNGVSSYTYMNETKNAEKDSLECAFPQAANSVNIKIVTHYTNGNATSEPITIYKTDFDKLIAAVNAINADNGLKIALAANAVSINDEANIHVLSADGKQVANAQNASSLSLAGVHGAYVVFVEKNGKILKAVKGVRK